MVRLLVHVAPERRLAATVLPRSTPRRVLVCAKALGRAGGSSRRLIVAAIKNSTPAACTLRVKAIPEGMLLARVTPDTINRIE